MANAILTLPEHEIGHLATVTVSSGSEDADFPATLLADGLLNPEDQAQPAKVTGTAGDWLIDHGSAKREDIVFFWHNGDEDVVLGYKRGSTTGVGDMNASVTLPAKRGNGHTKVVAIVLTDVTGHNGNTGYQYSKVIFPTNSVPPGLKILIFRTFTQLVTGIMPGLHDLSLEPSIKHVTEGGQVWPYRMPGARKALTMQTKPTDADRAALQYWFEAVGDTDVTAFVLDGDQSEAMICRVIGSSGISESHDRADATLDLTVAPVGPKLHQLAFTVVELSSGLPEWE
jgi:hypothetical protein